ncbi:hypothetical protein FPE49_000445 [Salmonella bongori]|nr:hypothetical protein [Salmonella bongori]EDP8647485.1 hypothetical protein [Salmonella bongori]HAB1661913.1 hypothetical protein [Salmonella bongori]
MRTPDRGSTTGAASWTDHEHREWAARRASKASQSPPHRHLQKRARTKIRALFYIKPPVCRKRLNRSTSDQDG